MSGPYTGQSRDCSHPELHNSESLFFFFLLVLSMDGACVSIKPGPTASWCKKDGASCIAAGRWGIPTNWKALGLPLARETHRFGWNLSTNFQSLWLLKDQCWLQCRQNEFCIWEMPCCPSADISRICNTGLWLLFQLDKLWFGIFPKQSSYCSVFFCHLSLPGHII